MQILLHCSTLLLGGFNPHISSQLGIGLVQICSNPCLEKVKQSFEKGTRAQTMFFAGDKNMKSNTVMLNSILLQVNQIQSTLVQQNNITRTNMLEKTKELWVFFGKKHTEEVSEFLIAGSTPLKSQEFPSSIWLRAAQDSAWPCRDPEGHYKSWAIGAFPGWGVFTTLWSSRIAMENDPFIDHVPIVDNMYHL